MLTILSLVTSVALADEPTASKTYWVVAGTSEYQARERDSSNPLPSPPGVEGATEDCREIVSDLTAFGFPVEQVLSYCGDQLIKAEVVGGIKRLKEQMVSGDTLVVVWQGHGGIDQKNDPGQTYWQTYDGSFSVDGDADGASYTFSGLTPKNLEAAIRRFVPEATPVLFLTDSARSTAVWQGITLTGPSAEDLSGANPYSVAYSPSKGAGQAGFLPEVVGALLHRQLAFTEDNVISSLELNTIVPIQASMLDVPLSRTSANSVLDNTPLIYYPSLPSIAMTKMPSRSVIKPALRYGGIALTAVSAITGGVLYAQASAFATYAEEHDYAIDASRVDDWQAYDGQRIGAYTAFAVAGLGLAVLGTSFFLPDDDLHPVAVTTTGNGVVLSGSF